jgi:putative oxidoreductase
MTSEQTRANTLNIILWIAQILLSASFIWAGLMKLFSPGEKLATMWPWTAENITLVKFTGVLDILAGIGLVLPGLLRIQPKITIYSAYGTILLMIAASIFHISRGEASQIGANIFFLALAIFIAWGRSKKVLVANPQN